MKDSLPSDDSGDGLAGDAEVDANEALADGALREFLHLRRQDPEVVFEAFCFSYPDAVQQPLAAKYAAFLVFEGDLGESAEIDRNALRDIIDKPLRKSAAALTESFDGVMVGPREARAKDDADSDVPDAQIILDELAELGALAKRYESQGRIAKGGMGIIHRVWDRQLRRRLAMKIMRLPADDVNSLRKSETEKKEAYARALARFQDEALVTSQLDHPGILPVHDLGARDDGRAYFTMKYVAGRRDLRRIFDLVDRGQDNWNVNRAVGSILRVCEAVAYAHSKGVLHRDIKPSNIMVGDFGATYLLDWGLALRLHGERRFLGGDDERAPYVASEAKTGSEGEFTVVDDWVYSIDGRIVGTPPYMSPEQARGDSKVGARSDIYSVGALLYHLLTGHMPYYEPDELPLPFTILMKVRQGAPPPVRELAPDAPTGLVQICERAMARHPVDRYATAGDMAVALEDYLEVISDAREEARRQEQRATTINEFLQKMLASGDPARAQGREVTVRQVLDEAAAGLEAGMAGLPLDEASLRNFIGTLYKDLGHYEIALPHAEKAYHAFEALLGADHPDTMRSATDVAVVYRITGRLAEAEELLRRVLKVQVEALGDTDPASLRTRDVLAETIRRGRGRLSDVEQLLREVAVGREQRLGEDHLDSLTALNHLANVLCEQGGEPALNEAERLLRRALAGLLRTVKERHPSTLIAMNDL
ncbi:MAG: serine/threonine protein kinase, partial [Pseudohongiellaceae bacterium]